MTVNGYLPGTWIKRGGFKKAEFISWIEQTVLPQTVLGQILIMDNCTIHHDEYLIELAAAYGVRIEYLPPYSPHLNPIELSFNELKQ